MIHKTTRSILSVLLAALLLVTSVPLTPAFAGGGGGVSLQSESGEGLFAGGTGTANDPYQIATAEELLKFAQRVNGTDGNSADPGAHAKLMNDIDLSEICGKNIDGQSVSWTPIGSDSSRYSGTFNGDGHTISGLYIDSSDNDQGLFGYVSGTVQNLSVSGSVNGNNFVGGVVGYNGGTVENCYNTGAVNSSGNRVGGVVGYNSSIGNVKNCYNTGNISGNISYNDSGNHVGGVVGYNDEGRVENCHNIGSVSGNSYVGGVVGWNISSGNVTNCYNTGSVKGSGIYVGGVVGNNGGSVTNCYNTGEVSGTYVGGVVGMNSSGDSSASGTVTGCYFLQENDVPANGIGGGETTGATAVDDLSDLCDALKGDTTWSISENLNRPVLKDNHEDDGTKDHPYEIFTAAQLKTFRDIVNGGENGNPAAWAVLMENIDLEGSKTKPWTPIGIISQQYSGTFDGNGKTISGLYIKNTSSDTDYQGLFGFVGRSGKVQNLSVSGDINGNRYVGGVVGWNGGTVTGCIFSGSGSVSGSYSVGGVVGDNRGTVENCHNIGAVSGSGWFVGGVVGDNSGTVKNCYNIGDVSGKISVGGVVGWNISSGNVKNCYYQIDKGATVGIGNETTADTSKAEGKTDAQFASGEVAWRLQDGQADGSSQVWGQNLMKEPKDNYPQLRAFDADTPQVYKVAFMNDSEEHDAKYANSGMTVTPPEEPKKTDHLFGGWFNNGELTGDPVTGPISVNSDTTYYAKWTPFSYTLSATPDTLNFGSITEGEERPAAQNVTITNSGNQTVTLVQPTANNFEITTSDNLTLAPGETATFTIQPKDKLPRGSYSEQIVVSNTNDEKATLTATFTVKEPPYTGKYSYEVSTSVGDNGAISVDRYATEGDTVTIQVAPDQAYKLDDLTVTAHGKDVELTANSDGTYSFTMPSADVRISATFAEDPDWTEPEEPTTDVSDLFSDIAPDAWYKDAVQYAYDSGLMTGVSANEFAPEATTTRAMIVSILARLEGVTTAQAAGFADVDDEWYATAVNWAANVGVVNGYEDNTFQPNTAITREQLAAILMNYAAYKGEDVSNRVDLTSYTDQPSTWAEEAMSWAVAEGLINGVTNDQLQPQGNATRAQVAAILQRLLEA